MKILMLCSAEGNQKALSFKIQNSVGLDALILCNNISKAKKSRRNMLLRLWRKATTVLTLFHFRRAWFGMLSYYDKSFKEFCIQPNLVVADINSQNTIDFISDFKPDLVVVSGTNLLKDALIEEIHRYGKVINLHTGISPYVKGGPNCTNWCLFLKEFNLIGNTVMWLDKGIDTGNIVTTERTCLSGDETLLGLHIKVMNHAHSLYVEAICSFVNHHILPSVSQNEFDFKRLFLSKQWGLYQMLIALYNFYFYFHKGSNYFDNNDKIRLIKLKS